MTYKSSTLMDTNRPVGSSKAISGQEQLAHASADPRQRRCITTSALGTQHRTDVGNMVEQIQERQDRHGEQPSIKKSHECRSDGGEPKLGMKSTRISESSTPRGSGPRLSVILTEEASQSKRSFPVEKTSEELAAMERWLENAQPHEPSVIKCEEQRDRLFRLQSRLLHCITRFHSALAKHNLLIDMDDLIDPEPTEKKAATQNSSPKRAAVEPRTPQRPTHRITSTWAFREHLKWRMRPRNRHYSISDRALRALDKCLSQLGERRFVLLANRTMFRRHLRAIKDDKTIFSLGLTPFLQRCELEHMSRQDRIFLDTEVDSMIEQWVMDKDGSILTRDERYRSVGTCWSAQQLRFYSLDKDSKGLLIARFRKAGG